VLLKRFQDRNGVRFGEKAGSNISDKSNIRQNGGEVNEEKEKTSQAADIVQRMYMGKMGRMQAVLFQGHMYKER